jgi:prepilin-type N-terminal cleavage/methylation domain-containing protein
MSKEEKGFTLVELLVVIVILGVLAGIGIPTYRGFIDRSHEAATLAELQAVSMAIKFYFMEHEEGSFELSKLKRYLGDEDFTVDNDNKSMGKYLDYSLTVESGQEYIIAQTDAPKRSKKAWIYLKDIGDDDDDDKYRRGDIVFDDPNPSSGS